MVLFFYESNAFPAPPAVFPGRPCPQNMASKKVPVEVTWMMWGAQLLRAKLAAWQPGWLPGLAAWLAGWLAWLAGRQAGWLAGLAPGTAGSPRQRPLRDAVPFGAHF